MRPNKKVKLSLDSRERERLEEVVNALVERDTARVERDTAREELGRITRKYEDLVNKLRDKVECPVCFYIPKEAPVPVCPNGHVVCARCVREKCPTCRAKMEHGTSTLAVTVIDNIEHQCDHEGCDLTFSSSDLPSHMSRCGHRSVKCPALFCSALLQLSSLRDHVFNSCVWGAEIKPYKTGGMKILYATRYDIKDPKEKNKSISFKVAGMEFEDNIFFFEIARKAQLGSWFFFVQMAGSSEDTVEYRVTITVSRPKEWFSRGMYIGNTCPIGTSTAEEAADGGMCVNLKDEEIAKWFVKNTESGDNEILVVVDIFRA